jgi:hypothetical protein
MNVAFIFFVEKHCYGTVFLYLVLENELFYLVKAIFLEYVPWKFLNFNRATVNQNTLSEAYFFMKIKVYS